MKMGVLSMFSQTLAYPQKILRDIVRLVNHPDKNTYHPQAKRKSRLAISRDLLLWFARNKEINRFYYVYGFDKVGNDREREILPYKIFRQIRDNANLKPTGLNFNYACLLRDKFIFGQLLTSLQFPTPANIAFLNKSNLTWLDDMSIAPLEDIVSKHHTMDGFCKLLTGIQGHGAFPLRINDGEIFIGDREASVRQLQEKLSGHFLWQEKIKQHPDMSRLHPSSVNTIRMITFNNKGNVEVFCATQRIGTKNRSVDNWASGGIVVGIDLHTGQLRNEGLFKPGYGGRVEVHPNTGVRFAGYQIPFFEKAVEMACSLHRYFYGVHSIGWDIAMTPDGPMFIEGNEDWDGSIPMSLEKNFRSRFMDMFRRN